MLNPKVLITVIRFEHAVVTWAQTVACPAAVPAHQLAAAVATALYS